MLNQTALGFGINVENTTCGTLENLTQVDGGCGAESLQIGFNQDGVLNFVQVSSFGSADQGLVNIDGTTTRQVLNAGLLSLGNLFLAAGEAWTIAYVAGNDFGVDNFAVTAVRVPEPGTIALLSLGLLLFAVARRRRIRRD